MVSAWGCADEHSLRLDTISQSSTGNHRLFQSAFLAFLSVLVR